MEMDVKKIELLKWLRDVEDGEVLARVEAIKEGVDKESEFDFDKEWENGYSIEEAKAESKRRISEWWGTKKKSFESVKKVATNSRIFCGSMIFKFENLLLTD